MTARATLTISLGLTTVALLRGVLLLTEGLLLARALLILRLLLTVLSVTWWQTCQVCFTTANYFLEQNMQTSFS